MHWDPCYRGTSPTPQLPHTTNFSLFALPHETGESFVQRKIFIQASLSEESALIVGQVFGFYSLLNSVRILLPLCYEQQQSYFSVCQQFNS